MVHVRTVPDELVDGHRPGELAESDRSGHGLTDTVAALLLEEDATADGMLPSAAALLIAAADGGQCCGRFNPTGIVRGRLIDRQCVAYYGLERIGQTVAQKQIGQLGKHVRIIVAFVQWDRLKRYGGGQDRQNGI